MDEILKKRAKKIVDSGSVPLAHLQESIVTNELLDVIASKDFPDEIEISLQGVEMIKGEKGDPSELPSVVSVNNLPEVQKVEITNLPEQKIPVVNIPAPIVNVPAPIVNVDAPIIDLNQEDVVFELQKIAGILSEEKEEEIEKTEIVDSEGEPIDFKELFDKLGNKIGNIRTVVSGGGGGLNQDQLRATTLTTQDASYATQIDDVSTTSMTYIGKAGVGSVTSSAVWQIMRIDESGTPITTVIKWADGNNYFDNIWDNRTSLTYN